MNFLDIAIPKPSLEAQAAAARRNLELTKPRGSLGRLEELVLSLAAWQDDPLPQAKPAATLIFASDHGVSDLGVSAFPKAVTRAMVSNFLGGGAAASVLSKAHGIPLQVVDVGVAGGAVHSASREYRRYSVADRAVGDLVSCDAMDRITLEESIEAGRESIRALPSSTRVVVLGEMGIGNTTVASCLGHALLGGTAAEWVGQGTGVGVEGISRKAEIVGRAVRRLDGTVEPLEVLRRVGGRELAALVGAMLEAGRGRRTVLVDGFIVSSAALIALKLVPALRPALVFAHRSAEAAHGRLLDAMDARPILELGMRLGEGSGALVALWTLESACLLHGQMATFAEARVPDQC